jgi:hypothetical protein
VKFVIGVETWIGRLKSKHSGLAARAGGSKMATVISQRESMIESRFFPFCFVFLV